MMRHEKEENKRTRKLRASNLCKVKILLINNSRVLAAYMLCIIISMISYDQIWY